MAFTPTAAANLTVTGPSSHPADGTPATLTAKVTAQAGYPLSNQTVMFSLSGVGQLSPSPTHCITTGNGTCNVYISSLYNVGLATITATTTSVTGSASVNFIASGKLSAGASGLSYVTVAPIAPGTGQPTQVADGVSQMVVTAYAIDTTNQPMPAGTPVEFHCNGCSTSAIMTPASGAGSTTLSDGASTFTATVVNNFISTSPDLVKYDAYIGTSGTPDGSGYTPYTSAYWTAAIPASLTPPTNLTATGTCGSGPVSLNWMNVATATTYHVYVSTSASARLPWTNLANPHTPSQTDSSIAANTNYYFYVTAQNSTNTSAASAVVPFYCAPPAAPTGVTVSGGCATGNSVTVNWNISPSAATYQVSRSPALGTPSFGLLGTVSSPTTSYTDASAATNASYIYEVTAGNSAGYSAASLAANLTCPSTGNWLYFETYGPYTQTEATIVLAASDPATGAPIEPDDTISPTSSNASDVRFANRLPTGTPYLISIVSSPSGLTCFMQDENNDHAPTASGVTTASALDPFIAVDCGPQAWKQVASGATSGVGVATVPAGTLWIWGEAQPYDNLGLAPYEGGTFSPVQIGMDNTWVQVAAGGDVFAGIKSDGTLWQWGNDNAFATSYFGVADGATNTHTTPTQYGHDTTWARVAISGGGSQGLALKTDGTLWTWGYDNADLSGHTFYISATQVGIDTDWASVTASDNDAVLLKADGSAWAWGYDFPGLLPQQIGAGDGTAGDGYFATAAIGDYNIFLIDNAGALWGLGSNSTGELGLNSYASNGCYCFLDQPTLTLLSASSPAGNPWAAIGSGSYSGGTTGAVDTMGNLYVWGDNSLGQFGIPSLNGTTTQSDVPLSVGGGYADFVGGYEGFSFGIKTDASLWSWGSFAQGALGYPVVVSGPYEADPPFQPPGLVP